MVLSTFYWIIALKRRRQYLQTKRLLASIVTKINGFSIVYDVHSTCRLVAIQAYCHWSSPLMLLLVLYVEPYSIETNGRLFFGTLLMWPCCLQIITNGKYKSAQHRAITNSSRPRLSIATFHDPAKTRKISPAFQLVNESSPLYREVNYEDYVSSWYTKGPEGKRNIDALRINC